MDFEDILKDVGGFGRYQKILLIVFLVPYFVMHSWTSMSVIFNASTPDHWCHVPEISDSNLTLDVQKKLIRPPQHPSCRMYDVNYSQILLSGNLTVDGSWPTKQCIDGWQYDKTDYDATATTRWNMVCDDSKYSSVVVSMQFLGNLCGSPFYSYLSDRVGRKPMVFSLAVLIAVTEIGFVFSPNFALFIVLKFINSTTFTMSYVSAYIILIELVSPNIRSRVNGLSSICWTVGLSLLPLIAWLARNWIHLGIVTSSVAAGLMLYWKLLPESPSWLISKERYVEAHAIMAQVSKVNGRKAHEGTQLMQKIEKLGEKIKKENADLTDTPLDLLKNPTLRRRFFLVTVTWAGNCLPYYGLQVNSLNLPGSEFLNFFLTAAVDIPANFVGWYCLERFGRRWSSVVSLAVTAISCLLPVVFPPEFSAISLTASMLAKFSSTISYMVVMQQSPELMPTSLRGAGVGFSGTIASGATFLVPYVTYLGKYGTYIPFLIFSITSFLAGICASFLPETLNRHLPQTVADSENFEKNFKFFSCNRYKGSECDLETAPSCWTPAKVSSKELSPSVNSAVNGDSSTDVPVLKSFNPIESNYNAESTLHL